MMSMLMRYGRLWKKQKHCLSDELEVGDCWMTIALANDSGLILICRVGKHTNSLLDELMSSTEDETDCKHWNSDDWGGHKRILTSEISRYRTQRLERTNEIVRHQTGRWHLCQNKFSKAWDHTKAHSLVSGELLPLGSGSQSAKNNSSPESRISWLRMNLEWYALLPYNCLRHNRRGLISRRD